MATCSSILAWGSPRDRGTWRATVCKESDTTERLNHHITTSFAQIVPSRPHCGRRGTRIRPILQAKRQRLRSELSPSCSEVVEKQAVFLKRRQTDLEVRV